ncbi:uncharacterized protein LOC111598631 [Drosophila hydei]|uniref:Uncharacterized protein LOC111598631 n=1 Tax=Drosophila hydei TaxID=7224 RepID=A0A6J1LS16_DROHY|nr:uncharacterized protein LOC111598631 [Drosophila hydei]
MQKKGKDLKTMDDIFYDCRSEGEYEPETVNKVHEGVLKTCHGDVLQDEPQKCKKPMDMRNILRSAAHNAQILLRGLGVSCECIEAEEPQASCKFFYPATLAITARVHAESTCGCPPQSQCILRGSPVTLNLPIELNPQSGQVKVNIFQPAPATLATAAECIAMGAGDRRSYGLAQNSIRRPCYRSGSARKAARKVRWEV